MRRIACIVPLMLAVSLAAGCDSGSSTPKTDTPKAEAAPESGVTKVKRGGMYIQKGPYTPKPIGASKAKTGL